MTAGALWTPLYEPAAVESGVGQLVQQIRMAMPAEARLFAGADPLHSLDPSAAIEAIGTRQHSEILALKSSDCSVSELRLQSHRGSAGGGRGGGGGGGRRRGRPSLHGAGYDAFGVFGANQKERVCVFHSRSLKVAPKTPNAPHGAAAMRLEISAPRLASLSGKRQCFQAERCRKPQTHRTTRRAAGGRDARRARPAARGPSGPTRGICAPLAFFYVIQFSMVFL